MSPDDLAQVWADLDRRLLATLAHQGPPPVFATISGAHLYGFASPDSDVDLRGAFLTPAAEILGLRPPPETLSIDDKSVIDLDWVAHDLRKFARLMTNDNGYVMEQLYSPLVVVSGPAHEELMALGRGCITRPTVRHYLGFARSRRVRLGKSNPSVKHLLYAFRVLMTGIHLMRTGEIVAHLPTLNAMEPRPGVDELVARKSAGAEYMALDAGDMARFGPMLDDLEAALHGAHGASSLPEAATNVAALEAFVVRLRLEGMGG